MTCPASQLPLLEIRDLRISFIRRGHEVTVVDGVSFRLTAGKTLAIVGESGAGKTLSCRSLLGLLPSGAVVSGSASFDGNEILRRNEREMRQYRGKLISMVFQDPSRSLNPMMRVGHQIAEAIRVHRNVRWRTARTETTVLLELLQFSELERIYRSYPHELSGGMQQRIMIAIALAGKPRLLIADEATRSIDVTTQAEIMSLLVNLQLQQGIALIMITHDLKLAAKYSDDILVMKAGRVVEHGNTNSLFALPKMPYTRALLEGIAPFVAADRPSASFSPGCGSTPNIRPTPFLSARNVVHQYRSQAKWGFRHTSVYALAGVSLDLAPGEILGLVGETGSGKSTLARNLILEPAPTSGSVILNDVDLTRVNRRQLIESRRNIQMVFQDPYGSLNPKWTVSSIIEEPLIGLGTMKRAERRQRVREVLDLVGMPSASFTDRQPRSLSGGECQRVAIARALAPRPRLIILDEALSSLDAQVQRQLLDLLVHLRTEIGVTLLMISHDLGQIGRICDRVAVIHAGRLCEVGPTSVVLRSPTHPYTASLVASTSNSYRILCPREAAPP